MWWLASYGPTNTVMSWVWNENFETVKLWNTYATCIRHVMTLWRRISHIRKTYDAIVYVIVTHMYMTGGWVRVWKQALLMLPHRNHRHPPPRASFSHTVTVRHRMLLPRPCGSIHSALTRRSTTLKQNAIHQTSQWQCTHISCHRFLSSGTCSVTCLVTATRYNSNWLIISLTL